MKLWLPNCRLLSLIIHLFAGLMIGLVIVGCSTPPPIKKGEFSPERLFQYACSPGKTLTEAKGSVWVKVSSPESTGQFPANVKVDSKNHLMLEITNLFGGTQALITIEGDKFEIIDLRGKDPVKQTGSDYWGGIPLRWATHLFLGKIPCPSPGSKTQLQLGSSGELMVRVPKQADGNDQKFIYRFKSLDREPWPESLNWGESKDPSKNVEFHFDVPEKGTASPEKWEARSPQGQVKVKWRSRDISTTH